MTLARTLSFVSCVLLPALVGAAGHAEVEGQLTGSVGSADDGFTPIRLSVPVHERWYGFCARLQLDGKVLVLGYFASGPDIQGELFRLNSDGSLDMEFVPAIPTTYFDSFDGCSYNSHAVRGPLYLQEDGRVLFCYQPAPLVRPKMVRLFANGSLDHGFANGNGLSLDGLPELFLHQPDGRIIIGQRDYGPNSVAFRLLRFEADGIPDPSFSVALVGADCIAAAFQPDGKLLIRGAFGSVNGVARRNLVRLTPEGLIDDTFTPPSIFDVAPKSFANEGLGLARDGTILVSEPSSFEGAITKGNLVRLKSDGSLDGSFALNPKMFLTELFLENPDGSWLAGVFDPAGTSKFLLLRTDGSWESGAGLLSHVFSPQADGKAFGLSFRFRGNFNTDPDLELIRLQTMPSLVVSIRGDRSKVVLSWPASFTGFTIEWANDLTGLEWKALSAVPTNNGEPWQITIPLMESRRFFRLRRL